MAPQSLDNNGFVQGHVHIVIQQLTSKTTAPDAKNPSFFQALDSPSNDGNFSIKIPAGTLKATGLYRICTLATSFSHQPVVMPVAQRGAQDDCIRVNVVKV